MTRALGLIVSTLVSAALLASCTEASPEARPVPEEAVDSGPDAGDAGEAWPDAGQDAGLDAGPDAGWFFGTDCAASAPSSVPADSLRILILGPTDPDTKAIAAHLQGMLSADAGFVAPVVTGLTIEASADAGYLQQGESLMNFFYLVTGRDARLALLSEPWSYVVLLEQARFSTAYPEFYFEGVRALGCRARASGAKPILLMPWSADAAARAEVTYQIANGTFSIVAPAGFAWEAAQATAAPVWGRDDVFLAAATLYSTVTGKDAADTAYRPAGIAAAQLATIAHAAVVAEAGKVHYHAAFGGRVQQRQPPAAADFWFMSSGSSSEQIWFDRMNDILPRAGLVPHGTALGFTNPQKSFDTPGLALAVPFFQQHPYRVLLARTFTVDAATIAAGNGQPDLQPQVWDRHFDSDPSDGAVFINEMEGRLTGKYDEAVVLDLALIPFHLMFAKLKTARPSISLLSDGVHATYPVGYGMATMSVVSSTGLHATTDGLDADTQLAAQLADETIRQLSALSVTGAFVPDDPATRATAR